MNQRQHLKILLSKELGRRRQEKRRYDWDMNGRENQRPPEGNWRTWMILAGRGFGKTRTGAETLRQWIKEGKCERIALVGGSLHEVRSVMVEGESGLLNVHPAHERPLYIPSKRLIKWKNGAVAQFFGAEAYEQLRGPQFDCAWIDELAKFRKAEEVWQQLQLCLRLGDSPRCILTTTPRPTKLMKELIASPDVVVTKGSTFDNVANLAPTYIEQIRKQFLNTRLGAQELYAEMLTETAGALWQRSMIQYQQPTYDEANRPELERIVIAIDPATTAHDQSDETGIIVAGIDTHKQAYVLEDHSGKLSPNDWGRRVVDCYYRLKADRIVVEVNKGGDLVENVLKSIDPTIPLKSVRATRGKYTRAEPIAALYEQNRVFHAQPFTLMEQQICDYIPGVTSKSPDRMDALVWALTELLLESQKQPKLKIWG
ncbi:DNA-packaging protein [Candidatus Odyssella acanthamoebae]|uniref:DNA-packaging protein n=1 Tax=Candidatus Odyssella acanthamoebae TaxID=91604 RepID=UPI00068BEB75|nr:terminase family protein [Candidatus Paracaedibacter acanthamoebae]